MNTVNIKYELMVHNSFSDWPQIYTYILDFEQKGIVTRTFRRLDPVRQEAIVQAILDEALEKGPSEINIKQVASRAGVSIGSLYQYFGNRDGLMSFSIELCVRLLTDAFDQFKPYLTAMPLREALGAYLTGGMEWSQTMLGLIQFFGRAAYQGNPELAEKVVRPVAVAMRDTTRDILLAARERGEIRPDLDLDAATRTVNAWIICVADSQMLPYLNTYFQVSDGVVSFERALQSLFDILERGLMVSGENQSGFCQ
jgi:TetR/AcrR family transcriptional regulator